VVEILGCVALAVFALVRHYGRLENQQVAKRFVEAVVGRGPLGKQFAQVRKRKQRGIAVNQDVGLLDRS
jgi:hypothetical protein